MYSKIHKQHGETEPRSVTSCGPAPSSVRRCIHYTKKTEHFSHTRARSRGDLPASHYSHPGLSTRMRRCGPPSCQQTIGTLLWPPSHGRWQRVGHRELDRRRRGRRGRRGLARPGPGLGGPHRAATSSQTTSDHCSSCRDPRRAQRSCRTFTDRSLARHRGLPPPCRSGKLCSTPLPQQRPTQRRGRQRTWP